jgi:hypothetical protein
MVLEGEENWRTRGFHAGGRWEGLRRACPPKRRRLLENMAEGTTNCDKREALPGLH